MIDVGGILLSRWFWVARVLTTAIALIIVWKGIIMTAETVLYTPAEFLPGLLIIALLVGALPVIVRAVDKLDDTNKDLLRKRQIAKSMKFGMDFMAANFGVIFVAIIGAVFAPGIVCNALSIAPNACLCYMIGFIWAFFIGVCDIKTFGKVADHFRNVGKIKDLEKEIADEKKAETGN